jgi:hypothetical protein
MLEARLDDAQRTLKFSLIKERSLMEGTVMYTV